MRPIIEVDVGIDSDCFVDAVKVIFVSALIVKGQPVVALCIWHIRVELLLLLLFLGLLLILVVLLRWLVCWLILGLHWLVVCILIEMLAL